MHVDPLPRVAEADPSAADHRLKQRVADQLHRIVQAASAPGNPVLIATSNELVEHAQPVGVSEDPPTSIELADLLPPTLVSASSAIFDVLRDRFADRGLRNVHRAMFDISEEALYRGEDQFCVVMRAGHVAFLRGAIDLLTGPKTRELLVLFESLPREMQEKALTLMKTFAAQATRPDPALTQGAASEPPYTPPPLPPIGGSYKTLPSRVRMSAAEVIAFTKDVWGPWLKSCHPSLPCDAMTRQDLQDRDPRLYNRLQSLREAGALGLLFQTKTQRLDAIESTTRLEAAATGDLNTLARVAARLSRRSYRAERQPISSNPPIQEPSNPTPD